jgi:dihydrofolate reductase
LKNILLFQNMTLNGYFEAPGHDISWAKSDTEPFSMGGEHENGIILLGHRTYEMMKVFWPTPQAAEMIPDIAKFMNESLKVVVSHQPFDPGWKNVRVISDNVTAEIKKLKEQPGKDIIIFGSDTLCVTLLQEGLIDELQIMLNPVLLGEGTSMFKGIPKKIELELIDTHKLKSGNLLLTYQIIKN